MPSAKQRVHRYINDFAAGSDHQLLAAIGYAGTDAVADHWLNQRSGRDQKIVVSCSNKEIEKIEDVA